MADEGEDFHPACPERETEWVEPFRRAAGVGFVIITLYYIVTIAWWWRRRHHPFLTRRSFLLMCLSALGGYFEIVLVWLGPALGRFALPCDLFIWFVFMIVPFAGGTLAVRLVLFRNSSLFAQALLRENAGGKGLGRGAARAASRRSFFASVCNPVLFCGRRRFRVAEPNPPTADGGPPERRNSETSSSTGLNLIGALYLTTTRRFGLLVLSVFVLVGLGSIGSKYAPDQPAGKHCFGCHIGESDLIQFSVMIMMVVVVGLYMLWQVRHEPDPLGIIRELRVCMYCGASAVLGVGFTLSDPGNLRRDGLFEWLWLVSFAILVFHTIQCPVQVWMTYGTVSNNNESITLHEILESRQGTAVFESYLATEFSAENLYMVEAVKKFKDKATDSRYSQAQVLQEAQKVYDTYIKEGTMLEVNLSGVIRRDIAQLVRQRQITVDMFDEAEAEVFEILLHGSFPRFLNSEAFQQWDRKDLMPPESISEVP